METNKTRKGKYNKIILKEKITKKNNYYNKNRKHIKIKNKKDKSFLKKLKHEPGLKKPGDFTVSEGQGYPLVVYITLQLHNLQC